MKPAQRRRLVAPGMTIVVDTREQERHGSAYSFEGLAPSVRAALPAGDYSIAGHETSFAIERKRIDDLFRTIISERDRFVRELERLATYDRAYILVEATFREILSYRSEHWCCTEAEADGRGAAVVNSLNHWMIDYGIGVLFVDRSRELCRLEVLRLAEYYWERRCALHHSMPIAEHTLPLTGGSKRRSTREREREAIAAIAPARLLRLWHAFGGEGKPPPTAEACRSAISVLLVRWSRKGGRRRRQEPS